MAGIQRVSRVSSRPRNGRGMGQNSSPRLVLDLEKQGSKVSSLKWQRKRPKFRGIPRLVLEKAEEKRNIPRLVSSSPDYPSRTSVSHWLVQYSVSNLSLKLTHFLKRDGKILSVFIALCWKNLCAVKKSRYLSGSGRLVPMWNGKNDYNICQNFNFARKICL